MPQFQGVIFDIDGVLEFRGRPFPEAPEVLNELRRAGILLRFLSNGALRSRRTATESLRQRGIHIQEEELFNITYTTAAYLRQNGARSCWVMTAGAGLDDFAAFHHTRDDPEYVVVGEYRDGFDFANLNHALRLLKNGARLVGMDPELLDYTLGDLELNPGAWTQMLELASGVQAVYIGKPAPYCFEVTLQSMGLPRSQVVMVGDQPGTDILGARRVGIASILVRTGEYTFKGDRYDVQPDFTVNCLADILPLLISNSQSLIPNS